MEIDHVTVPVGSYGDAKRFYERALAPLGFSVRMDWPDRRRAYLGLAGEPASVWLCESDGCPGTLELSLPAADRRAVETFHALAVAAGARSAHAPGVDHDRSDGYYAARVLDPDGNVLEVVCRSDEPAAQPLAA